MTKEGPMIKEEDLLAYVDGALDPERREAVQAYLDATPEAAARVKADLAAAQALRAALGGVMMEPTPERLRATARGERRTGWGLGAGEWRRMAAAVALLLVGSGAGWTAKDALSPAQSPAIFDPAPAVARRAMAAHALFAVEMRHPVEVRASGAQDEAHLVSWLSKRLGRPISAPDLTGLGFSLIGGRLLPDEERAAAQFMYEDESGRRITLYAARMRNDGLAAFRFERAEGLESFFWRDDRLAYAVVGEIGRPALRKVALRVYETLS